MLISFVFYAGVSVYLYLSMYVCIYVSGCGRAVCKRSFVQNKEVVFWFCSVKNATDCVLHLGVCDCAFKVHCLTAFIIQYAFIAVTYCIYFSNY